MTKLFTMGGAERFTDVTVEELRLLCRLRRQGTAYITIMVFGEGRKYPLDVALVDIQRTFSFPPR